MKEIIIEDMATHVRTINQISLTKRGLVESTRVELINTDIANTETVSGDASAGYELVNFDKSVSDIYRNILVYDYRIDKHKDNHDIISFSNVCEMEFDMEIPCDNLGMVGSYFYISQSLELAQFRKFRIVVKDPYDDGSVLKMYFNGKCYVRTDLTADDKEECVEEFIIPIPKTIDEPHKCEFIIVGNHNVNARADLYISFLTSPNAAQPKSDNGGDQQ